MSAEEIFNNILKFAGSLNPLSKEEPVPVVTPVPVMRPRSRSQLPIKVRPTTAEHPVAPKKLTANLSRAEISRQSTPPFSRLQTSSSSSINYNRQNVKPDSSFLSASKISGVKSPTMSASRTHALGHLPAYLLRMKSESKTVEFEWKKKKAELENMGRTLEEMQGQFLLAYGQFKGVTQRYNEVCERQEVVPKYKFLACLSNGTSTAGTSAPIIVPRAVARKTPDKVSVVAGTAHDDSTIETKLRSLPNVGIKLFEEFCKQTLQMLVNVTEADCGKLLSAATELVNEFKTKLAEEDQACRCLVESIIDELHERVKHDEDLNSRMVNQKETMDNLKQDSSRLISDLKQQHNYDVKIRELEIFKLQNKIEELERSNKELGSKELELKLKATEEKLQAMTKSEEESQRVLKIRTGVIKELENTVKGMQQQIEQLCCQVSMRHDFDSEVD